MQFYMDLDIRYYLYNISIHI